MKIELQINSNKSSFFFLYFSFSPICIVLSKISDINGQGAHLLVQNGALQLFEGLMSL